MTRHLVVMLKTPEAGRVKTRLGGEIGMVPAAWWFRHQTRRLLRRIEDPRWQITLALTPDVKGLKSRQYPGHFPRIPQGAGHLGDRMARVFRSMPTGPVCIIGGDIPGVQSHHINHAFQSLGSNEAVFGPAMDGGYWLVGLKHPSRVPPSFLQNVRWSTEHARADSIASIPDMRVALADRLQDVDTADDLQSLSR